MSRRSLGLLLLAAAVALAAAWSMTTRRNASSDTHGATLMPGLAGDLSAVTSVTLRKGGTAAVTLRKDHDTWTIVERGNYPADVGKLRQLLIALRDARIVEEKTADPQRYAVIGVDDPAHTGAQGAEITVSTTRGNQGVIVGKPAGEGSFVRRVGEKPSYSVEPAISVETEPHFWIDGRLLDVAASRIEKIDVKLGAGLPGAGLPGAGLPGAGPTGAAAPQPVYALHRVSTDTFALDGVPAGRKALEPQALAPSPTTLSGLTAEDVAQADTLDFTHASQVVVTLTDGNVLTLTGAIAGDKHWLQVAATKDAALTAKSAGRAFEIASYRYDALFKPLEQLLAPKAAPAAKPVPAGKGTPAAKP